MSSTRYWIHEGKEGLSNLIPKVMLTKRKRKTWLLRRSQRKENDQSVSVTH